MINCIYYLLQMERKKLNLTLANVKLDLQLVVLILEHKMTTFQILPHVIFKLSGDILKVKNVS